MSQVSRVRSGVESGPAIASGWATVEGDAEEAVVRCAHALGFRGLVLVDGLEWAAEWAE